MLGSGPRFGNAFGREIEMRHARRISGWVMWAAGILPTTVLAFGAQGHRITGYVAEAQLSAQARAELASHNLRV